MAENLLKPENPNYLTVLSRAWRLRCPRCGAGRLFKNWFSMYDECRICELRFEREPGYFLGSIYVNYGITAALVTAGYMMLFLNNLATAQTALWIVTVFAFLFPVGFFRYARSLWLGFDHYWDPLPEPPPIDAPANKRPEPWE